LGKIAVDESHFLCLSGWLFLVWHDDNEEQNVAKKLMCNRRKEETSKLA
jgi:hypothetical protein